MTRTVFTGMRITLAAVFAGLLAIGPWLTPPATAADGAVVTTRSGSLGTFLTDASGRSLYLWTADTAGQSTCYGACASAWPPLTTAGAPTAAGGAQATELGTVARTDGTTQVTYHGHPLYRYVGDAAAGQTNGQGSNGFGAPWWLVTPAGTAITGGPSTSPSPSPSTPPTGGTSTAGKLTAGKPRITGEAEVGHRLTAHPGTWKPAGVRLSYRWFAAGKRIVRATKPAYRIAPRFLGKRITVRVTGTKSGYAPLTVVSKPTHKVRE